MDDVDDAGTAGVEIDYPPAWRTSMIGLGYKREVVALLEASSLPLHEEETRKVRYRPSRQTDDVSGFAARGVIRTPRRSDGRRLR
jgi:hypothetical protein